MLVLSLNGSPHPRGGPFPVPTQLCSSGMRKKLAQAHHCSYLSRLRAARALLGVSSKLIESVLLQALVPKHRLWSISVFWRVEGFFCQSHLLTTSRFTRIACSSTAFSR